MAQHMTSRFTGVILIDATGREREVSQDFATSYKVCVQIAISVATNLCFTYRITYSYSQKLLCFSLREIRWRPEFSGTIWSTVNLTFVLTRVHRSSGSMESRTGQRLNLAQRSSCELSWCGVDLTVIMGINVPGVKLGITQRVADGMPTIIYPLIGMPLCLVFESVKGLRPPSLGCDGRFQISETEDDIDTKDRLISDNGEANGVSRDTEMGVLVNFHMKEYVSSYSLCGSLTKH